MDPILHKFREKFLEEAYSLMDRLEKDLLELEQKPEDKDLIESAFRAMHTIKGVSSMYGFDFIAEFTHSMESVYQAIRDGKLKFNKEIFDLTFLSIDHIRKLLEDEKMTDVDNQSNHNLLLNEVVVILDKTNETEKQYAPADKPPKEKSENAVSWHIMLKTDEQIYFRSISLISIFRDLAQLGEFQTTRLDYMSDKESDIWSIILVSSASQQEIFETFLFIEDNVIITKLSDTNILEAWQNKALDVTDETIDNEPSIQNYIENPGKSNEKDTEPISIDNKQAQKKLTKVNINKEKHEIKRISVDSEKLDNLMYLVSELITVNSQLSLSTNDPKFNSIRQYLEKVDNLSKMFRNTTLDIRLVPLSDTILRFQRLIRDLSQQLKKKIELVTQGIDTELDKNTIDMLNEPLMHIIRNCIDHGIELPADRLKKGKPETGIIKISAYHSGNYVVIKIEDDGSGIDPEKIREKAIEKGFVKPNDQPDKKELFDMIFLPGFSTAKSITEVSGRGVGLDVVRKKIIELRGDVSVDSEMGAGTSFTLRLQQSVAIIDTLLFKVEDSFFTVPLSDIFICSQIGVEEINKRKHTSTIPYDNNLIPFIDLRQNLNINGEYGAKIKLVILNNNERQVALLTDKIVGEHQAVLKPLGKAFKSHTIINSASQLGDGNIAFMIDTNELFKITNLTKKSIA
jgi:two-component system chemotaxis sensor kinase CheA